MTIILRIFSHEGKLPPVLENFLEYPWKFSPKKETSYTVKIFTILSFEEHSRSLKVLYHFIKIGKKVDSVQYKYQEQQGEIEENS